MTDHVEQIRSVVEAVTLRAARFSWFGHPEAAPSPVLTRALGAQGAREWLLSRLAHRLYRDFYSSGGAEPRGSAPEPRPPPPDLQVLRRLSRANAGVGRWDEGWRVREVSEGEVIAERDGLLLRARPDDCRFPPGSRPGTGSAVALRLPKELPRATPGAYLALGDAAPHPGSMLRMYWNLEPPAAIRFVRHATTALNAAGVPFDLKVLVAAGESARCDAVVLYAARTDYPILAELLAPAYRALAGRLRPGIPALTKRLAPGVGLAEDPGSGGSFGMHRCRLLAAGLLRSRETGSRDARSRLRTVLDHLVEARLDPERPYLSPGSGDVYARPQWSPAAMQGTSGPAPQPGSVNGSPAERAVTALSARSGSFLEAADAIGRRLTETALWHAGRCNWLGPGLGAARPRRGGEPLLAALGPELYEGTSGIGLFLAELSAATGDRQTRRAAVGALRQAVATASASTPGSGWGLYAGRLGIAVAAARAGRPLQVEELQEGARRLLARTVAEPRLPRDVDLLSGRAGAICALLVLEGLTGEVGNRRLALELADELLRMAERSEGGWSWRVGGIPCVRNPTGLSHGASGVGLALLEVYSATGEERHRFAAREAFAYERRWFDARSANWPDLRRRFPRDRRTRDRPSMTAWCHGAPGIALARLRACELIEDDVLRDEAELALATTSRAARLAMDLESGPGCLCHGWAGLGDVLLEGRRLAGVWGHRSVEAAQEIGEAGLERLGGRRTPCGRSAEEQDTPGLLPGLAGIGHFYLRLHDPRVPSVLLFRREDYRPC